MTAAVTRIESDVLARICADKLAHVAVRKAEAPRLYEDLSPPRPQLDPVSRLLRRAPAERERGTGRPTKRERRRLEKWRRS